MMLHHIHLIATEVTSVKPNGLPTVTADSNTLSTILGIFFGVLGALAILMIVVSGLRYIVSAGDTQRAAQAKNGIVYALVGLAIAISAQAIVYFVVNKL